MNDVVEQRDAADEGWLESYGGAIVGTVIVLEGRVVHPSQLIASVRRTRVGGGGNVATTITNAKRPVTAPE